LRVAEPNAAELEILLEEGLVVGGEVAVVGLVDHLGHADDVANRVLCRRVPLSAKFTGTI
jgi:hypothetical protein